MYVFVSRKLIETTVFVNLAKAGVSAMQRYASVYVVWHKMSNRILISPCLLSDVN